jgi:hypothetical protein
MSEWTQTQPSTSMDMEEAEEDVGIRVKVLNVFFYSYRLVYNLVVGLSYYWYLLPSPSRRSPGLADGTTLTLYKCRRLLPVIQHLNSFA